MGLRGLIKWITKEQTRRMILEQEQAPICEKCGQPMSLEYYDRPSGRLGNRYVPTCDCDLRANEQEETE